MDREHLLGPGAARDGDPRAVPALSPLSATGKALLQRLRAAKEIYEGVYVAPYRSLVLRERRRQRDLFLLAGFSDLLGVPSPMGFYTLELLPELIESFHQWHLSLGLEHPPEGGFRCC